MAPIVRADSENISYGYLSTEFSNQPSVFPGNPTIPS
jgi:hypothetical protein